MVGYCNFRREKIWLLCKRKAFFILKNNHKLEEEKKVFSDSAIKYNTSGKRHLGAAIGVTDFRREYATEKISQWCNEMKLLTEIAITEPQAALQHIYTVKSTNSILSLERF